MRRFVYILPTFFFILVACALLSPFGTSTPPAFPTDLLQTVLAQTVTAQPTSLPSTPTDTPVPSTPTAFTPTPIPPSPSPTPLPSNTATFRLPAQSPEQFVRYYFDNINISNFALTWSLLSPRFKSVMNGPSQGGYQGYVNFWNTVHNVRVDRVEVVFECFGCVVVNVTARYYYNSGVLTTVSDTYILVYDYVRNTWLFESSLVFTSTPSPTRTRTKAPTRTWTVSRTPSSSPTDTHTPTFTFTPTPTSTFTPTPTDTDTPTLTPTETPTFTDTPTPTST
jgi:hypothetical protein